MYRDASEDSTTTATSIQFSVDSSFVGGDGGDGDGRSRRSSAGNKSSANRKTVLAKGAPWASAYSFHTVSPPATQRVKSKLVSGSTAPTAAAAPPKGSSQHPPLFPQQPSPPAALRGALVTSPASASSSASFVEAPVVLHPSRSVSPSDASLLFVQAVAKLDSPIEASLTKPKPQQQQQQQRQQEHDMSSDQESESRNADRDSYHPRLMPQGSTSKSGGGNMKSVSANLASHSITSSRDSIDFQVDDNDGDDAPLPPPIAPPAVSATAAREGDGERGGTSLPSKPLAQQPALSAVKTATPPATLTVGGKTLVLKTATAHGGAGAKASAAANAPPPCVVSPEQLTPMKTVTTPSEGGAAGPALMAPSSPPSRSPPPGHGGASRGMGGNDGQQQQQLLQRPVVPPIHATSQPSGAAVSTTSTQNRAGSLASPRHDVLSAHGPRGLGRSVLAAAAGEGTTALEPHLPSPLQPSRSHGEEDDDDARMHTLHQRTQSLSSPASTHISNIASGVHFNRTASFSHTSLPEPNHSNSGGGLQQRRASSVSVQPEDDPVYCTVSEMTNAASMRGGTLSMLPIGMATAASGGANSNSVASPRRPTLAPSATSAARHVQSFDMSLDESNAQLTMGTPRELSGRHGTGGSWRVKGSSAASQPNLAGDAAATASNSTPSPTTLSPSPTYSNVRHVMPLPTFSRPNTAGKGDGDGKQSTASTNSAPFAVAATAAPRSSSRGHAGSLASGAGVNPNSRSGRTSQSGEGSGRPSAARGVEDQASQKQQQQQQQQPRRRSGVSAVLNALGGKLLQRRRESGSTASKSGTDDDDGNNDADGSATSLRSRHSTSHSFISGLSRVSSRLKRGARKAIAAGRTSGKEASSKQTSDLRNNSGAQQAAAVAATTERGTDAATEAQTVADTATNTTVTMAPADQPTPFDSAARGRGGRGPGGGDGDGGGGGGGAVLSLMAPHALSPTQLQLVRPTPTRDNQSLSVDGSIDFYTDVEEKREAEMLASHEGLRGLPRPIANASDTAPHSGTVPSQPRLPMQEAEEYRDNGSSSARGGEEREHEAGEEEEGEDGTAAQPRNDGATQRKKRKEEKPKSRHRHRSHKKHHHHRSRTSTMSDNNNNSNREDAVLADESSSSTSSSSPASSASITSSVLRRQKERERRRRRQHRNEKRRRKETANQKSTADAERSADKRLNESQQARQREMESRSAATQPRQRRVMSANASAVTTFDEEQRRRSSSWHRTRHGARARHNAKKDKAGVMLMGKQLYHSKLGEEAVHLYAAAEEYVRRRLRRSCERQDERSGVTNGADAHERGRTAASSAQAGSNHRLRRQRQGKQGRKAGDAGNAPEQSLAAALAARRRAILAESRVHSSVNHFRAAWHNHTMDRQRRWLQQYDAYKDWRRKLQQREKERKLRSQEAAIAAAVATAASRSASRSRAMLDEVSCSKNAKSRNSKSPSARPAAREASLKNGVSLTGRAASVLRQQRLDAYETALTSEIALLDEAIEKMRRHALWAEASPEAAAIAAESNTHKEPQDAGAPAMSADEHVATPLPHRQPTSACSRPQGGAPKAEKPVTLSRTDQNRNDANAEQRGSKQQRKTQYSSLTEAADAVRCAPPSVAVACRTPARTTVELQRRYEELLDEMVAHMEGGEARVGNNRSNSATSLAGRRRSSAQGSQKSPVHVPSKRFTPWRGADEEGKAGARQCAEALRAEYYRLSRFSSTPPADMQRQRPPQPLSTASEEGNTSSPMKREEEEEEEVLARIEKSYAQALRPSCAVCRPQRFDEYVTLGLLSMLHSTSEPSTDVVRNAADATGTGTGARPAKHPSSPRTLLQRRIREDLYAPPKRSSKPHVAGAASVTAGVMVEAPQLAPPPQPPPQPEPHPFTPSLSLVLDSLRARLMKDERRARAMLIAAEEAAAEALRRQYIIATICTLRALRAREEAEEAAKEKARETLQLQLQQQQQQQQLLQQALSSHSYGSSRRLFEEEQEEEEDQQHVTHEPVAPAIATASEPSFSNALLVGRSDNLRGDDSSSSSSHRRSDNEEEEEDYDDLRGRCHADRLGDRDAQSRCSSSSGSCGSRPHTRSWRGTTPPPLHAERLDEGNRREHLPSVESDDHHHHNNGSAGVVRRALQRDVALLQNVSASRVTEPSHGPLSSARAGADYTRMSSGSSGNVRGHGPFSSTQPGSPASEEPMHELETRNAASAAGENSTPSTASSQSSRGEAAQSSASDDDHDGENQRRHSEDASTPLFELHDDKDREESDSKKDSSQASSTTHVTPSAESLPLPAAPPAALHVEKGTTAAETAKEVKDASCSQREDGKELSNAVRRTPEGPAHAGNAERHGDDDSSSASLEFQTNEDEASKADSAAASDESPTSNSGSNNNKSRRSSILLTQTDTSMTSVVAAPSTNNQETSHISEALTSVEKATTTDDKVSSKGSKDACVRPLSIDRNDHLASSCPSSDASPEDASDVQSDSPDTTKKDTAAPDLVKAERRETQKPTETAPAGAREQEKQLEAEAAQPPTVDKANTENGKIAEKEEDENDDGNDDDEEFVVHAGAATAPEKAREEEKAEIGVTPQQHDKGGVFGGEGAKNEPVVLAEVSPSDNEADVNAEGAAGAAAHPAAGDAVVEGDSEVAPAKEAAPPSIEREDDEADGAEERKATTAAAAASAVAIVNAGDAGREVDASPPPDDTTIAENRADTPANSATDRALMDAASQTPPLLLSCLVQRQPSSPRRRVRFSLPPEHAQESGGSSDEEAEGVAAAGRDDEDKRSEHADVRKGAEISSFTDAATPEKPHDSPRAATHERDDDAPHNEEGNEAEEGGEDGVSERTATDLLEKLNQLDALLLYEFPSYFTTGTDRDGFPAAVMRPLRDTYKPRRISLLPAAAAAAAAAAPTATSLPGVVRRTSFFTPAPPALLSSLSPSVVGMSPTKPSETLLEVEEPQGAVHKGDIVPPRVEAGDAARGKKVSDVPAYQPTPLAPPQLPAESLASQLRRKYGLRPPPSLSLSRPTTAAPAFPAADRLSRRSLREVPTLPSSLSSTHAATAASAAVAASSPVAVPASGAADLRATTRMPPAAGSESTAVASRTPAQPAAKPRPTTTDTSIEAVQEPATAQASQSKREKASADFSRRAAEEAPPLSAQQSRLPTPNDLTAAQKTALLLSDRSLSLASSATTTQASDAAATAAPLEQARLEGEELQQLPQQPSHTMQFSKLSVPVKVTAATVRHTVPSSLVGQGGEASSFTATSPLDSSPLSVSAADEAQEIGPRSGIEVPPLARPKRASHWF